MNILILGCGKLGKALAIHLFNQGHCVTCISRTPKILPEGIIHLCQDIHSLNLKNCPIFDVVYVIVSPNQRTLTDYQSAYLDTIKPIYHALTHQLDHLKHIIYISSTRVYQGNQGERIDDNTPILPYDNNDPFANIVSASELLYQAYFAHKAIIIRPSGLYRGNSERLNTMAKNLEQVNDNAYMNLIDYNDVVRFLGYLLTLDNPKPSYILNGATFLRAKFLNALRQQQGLAPIEIDDNLPITGKQLIAHRMHQSGFKLEYLIDIK